MFHRKKQPTPQGLANDIARNISRRGWPAEARAITICTPFGYATRWAALIPRRGVAVIDDALSITVASSNRPTFQATSFNHTTAEADAERTLRNLPLP